MTRHKAFLTAAARRRKEPIVWTIDDVEVRLRDSVDLAEIADVVEEIQAPIAKEANQIRAAAEKRNLLVETIRTFVAPDDYPIFDSIQADLDLAILPDMLSEVIAEYTGTGNPTSEPLSSGGSSPTGPSSTDGAAPEV